MTADLFLSAGYFSKAVCASFKFSCVKRNVIFLKKSVNFLKQPFGKKFKIQGNFAKKAILKKILVNKLKKILVNNNNHFI